MSEKKYVRNPNGLSKGYGANEEDEEDFEQEKRIKEWLAEKPDVQFGYKYINSKGAARHSRVRANISLDQKIKKDSSNTFADIIAGYDGRVMECGRESNECDVDPKDQIKSYLLFLGFAEGDLECLIKLLKKLILENKSLLPKSQTDSEW